MDAISRLGHRVSELKESERNETLAEISDCISEHVRVLSPEMLAKASFTVMDDLYVTLDQIICVTSHHLDYLQASAGTFFQIAAKRGTTIHYLVDNSFQQTEAGMSGPADAFYHWFRAAGIVYICPQGIAKGLMKHDGVHDRAYIQQLPRYIDEARDVAQRAVVECHQEGRHYLYLDTDWPDNGLGESENMIGKPGIVTVFRNEAPKPGSSVKAWFPEKFPEVD